MERTKQSSHILVKKCNFGPKELAIKNNIINRSSFVFPQHIQTTTAFKQLHGLKKHESPRSYASPAHLSAVSGFEAGMTAVAEVFGADETKEQLLNRIREAGNLLYESNKLLGLHRLPLMPVATVPVHVSALPANERFVAIEAPVPGTGTEVTPRKRAGNLPTQNDINGLWERSKKARLT